MVAGGRTCSRRLVAWRLIRMCCLLCSQVGDFEGADINKLKELITQ